MIKDSTQLGCYNPPACNITEQPKNTSRGEAAVGHPHSDPSANNAAEQSFIISDLPPPDLGDMSGEFGLVIQHITPSSHIDDDDNELIKESTQLGYRNPPEEKFRLLSHHKYNRQKSTPTDASLPGEMTVSATGTAKSNRLPVSDHTPVVAAVPLSDQPTPEASQAPIIADSKFGKTNLHVLKNRFQHKKELTETMVQSGTVGSRPQPSSDYVNFEASPQLFQGVSDNTNKPTFGKSDLASLRSKLDKAKKEMEKTVGVANRKVEYGNLSDISTYVSENPVMLNNPLLYRKPVAASRSKTSANFAGSHTHSASSTSSSIKTYKLWQCAHCQVINEAHCNFCVTCRLPQGKMADRSYFCEFCQLRMYVSPRNELVDVCCPRCKKVYEESI